MVHEMVRLVQMRGLHTEEDQKLRPSEVQELEDERREAVQQEEVQEEAVAEEESGFQRSPLTSN